jgi:tripartite ATP-independent transporter DctM subunit
MFFKMHVGIAMMIAGFIGIMLSRGVPAAFSTLGTTVYRVGSSEYLAVIPLFVLMGILAGSGGVSAGAFNSFYKWFGHLKGGLAMATIGACAVFGAVCGDNIATAATMAKVALPEMRKYGYSDELSTGAIAAGGNLGILIPPSTAFIVYGFVTQTAIGALFIAGIVPGILLTIFFMGTAYIQCTVNPSLATTAPAASWKERIIAIKGIWGIALVFIVVMGGLLAGYFTPSEAGAVGSVAVVLVSLVNRRFVIKDTARSLLEAGKITAMIMLLIFGAMMFSHFLTTAEIAQAIASTIESANLSMYIVMAIVIVIFLILGCIMDIWALLIITLPIFFPLVTDMGFDPLQFGVLSVLCIMAGCITPPVGVVVFALSGMVRDVPLFTIFRGATPYLLAMVVLVILLVIFPQISTFLPDLMIPFR